jgi:urease gamma subunit
MAVRPKHVADNLNKIVKTIQIELRWTETPERDLIHATGCKHPSLRLLTQVKGTALRNIYFPMKMVVRPKHVGDNLNKIIKNIEIEVR